MLFRCGTNQLKGYSDIDSNITSRISSAVRMSCFHLVVGSINCVRHSCFILSSCSSIFELNPLLISHIRVSDIYNSRSNEALRWFDARPFAPAKFQNPVHTATTPARIAPHCITCTSSKTWFISMVFKIVSNRSSYLLINFYRLVHF